MTRSRRRNKVFIRIIVGRCCTSLMTEAQLILQDLFTLFCSVRLTDRGLCNVFTVNDHNYTPAEITVIITINTSNKCSKQHCECCRVILLILVSAVSCPSPCERGRHGVSTVCRCLRLPCCEFVSCLKVVMEIAQTCGAAMLHDFKSKRVQLRNARVRQEWAARFIFKSLLYVSQDLPVIMPDGSFRVLDHKMRYKI